MVEKMNLTELIKIGVSHREKNSTGGVIVIQGDFHRDSKILNEIEAQIRSQGIMITAQTTVIENEGCIIRIDRYTEEKRAIKIIQRLIFDKTRELQAELRFAGNISDILNIESKISQLTNTQPSEVPISKRVLAKEYKPITPNKVKISKARKESVPVPYSV